LPGLAGKGDDMYTVKPFVKPKSVNDLESSQDLPGERESLEVFRAERNASLMGKWMQEQFSPYPHPAESHAG
jgi:hypothetical protein